jgi:hypothetical protein
MIMKKIYIMPEIQVEEMTTTYMTAASDPNAILNPGEEVPASGIESRQLDDLWDDEDW